MSQGSPAPLRGRFLVLDGIDGCGKSTQAARLVRALAAPSRPEPLHLREPGGTELGERIRELLLSRQHELSPAVETLLFAAARRQMLEQRVAPALAVGRDVVCERFNSSTFAYQAVAGALQEQGVLELLLSWANDPAPDLVIWIDVPLDVAEQRRGAPLDRIEDKGAEFQRRVHDGFRRWAELVPGVVRVEGSGSEDEIAKRILECVERETAGARRG